MQPHLQKWTSLWVVLCTEISPSFCCISYCKKESDWLLNSKSIVKCPLGDFKLMRALPGYSKKHENVLQLVFSSYTLSLAFDSMTKMDDWYITLQTVTGEVMITLHVQLKTFSRSITELAAFDVHTGIGNESNHAPQFPLRQPSDCSNLGFAIILASRQQLKESLTACSVCDYNFAKIILM